MPKTTKNWQSEHIFVRGGDLAWLLYFFESCEPRCRVDWNSLSEYSLTRLVEVDESFQSWTEKKFFENNFLRCHNCMF